MQMNFKQRSSIFTAFHFFSNINWIRSRPRYCDQTNIKEIDKLQEN